MKKHRLLTCAVCVSLTLSSLAAPVFAKGFSDVDNDSSVVWAKTYIDQMTESGYIKGYEDGTFKPKRAISKLECLLLMSRMLGAEEADYADVSQKAKEKYSTTVSKYNTTYAKELCYLLYNGIITEDDLTTYASSANANTELLRYQAAILMSKLLGQYSAATAYSPSKQTYSDLSNIPFTAKNCVEYVSSIGVMNGMDSDAAGNPQFSPSTSLTRAQMAALLSRTEDKINKSYYEANVDKVSGDTVTLSINGKSRNYKTNSDTVVYTEDGERGRVANLAEGDSIAAVEINDHLQSIIVLGSDPSKGDAEKTSVFAMISQLNESADGKKITLVDSEDVTNSATYDVHDNCKYTISGASAAFGNFKKGQLVQATVANGKIIALETIEKSMNISGTLVSVDFDDSDHVYLTVKDSKDEEQKYVVSNKGASITRDGAAAEYRQLSAGDSVKLQFTNGKVVKISSTSNSEKFTGVLSEIILATRPRVTLTIDGESKTYYLRSDATITIAGTTSTVYDLRPNVTVSGLFDGDEVKSITASSISTNEKGEFSGTVAGVNTTFKVITITDTEGNNHSVYYNTSTTFLNSNGSSSAAKSIEKGASVSVTGADSNGIFVATIVIIK